MIEVPIRKENIDFIKLDLSRHYNVVDCDFSCYLVLNPSGDIPYKGTDIALLRVGSWQLDTWSFLTKKDFPNNAGFSACLVWDKTQVNDAQSAPTVKESDVDIANSVSNLKGQPVNITGFSMASGEGLPIQNAENNPFFVHVINPIDVVTGEPLPTTIDVKKDSELPIVYNGFKKMLFYSLDLYDDDNNLLYDTPAKFKQFLDEHNLSYYTFSIDGVTENIFVHFNSIVIKTTINGVQRQLVYDVKAGRGIYKEIKNGRKLLARVTMPAVPNNESSCAESIQFRFSANGVFDGWSYDGELVGIGVILPNVNVDDENFEGSESGIYRFARFDNSTYGYFEIY